MILFLKKLSNLSQEEQIQLVQSRIEELYKEKMDITQSILDIVAVNILPCEEGYITSDQEEFFLKNLKFEDIPKSYQEGKIKIFEQGLVSCQPIEVEILKGSGFRQSAFVSEIRMKGSITEFKQIFFAYLFPQKGAFTFIQQDNLKLILDQEYTKFWTGLANSILIVPENLSIDNLDIPCEYKVKIVVEKENPIETIKGYSVEG